MKEKLTKRFWVTMVILSLMGQIAWVVENMYFNVFIYKMFHATAAQISLMVGASAAAATLTTWLMGALSDRVGKRKLLVCGGYILWGISILTFALIRMDILTQLAGSTVAAASLGVSLVVIMDCVMTFFGSSANDASFNAWLTDCGDETNRGKIEGINSMMPLLAILVVFGGFMAFDLEKASSWSTIFLIIGIAVLLIGILCCFLMEEKCIRSEETRGYFETLFYSFRPTVYRENKLLYTVVGAFAIFGISIQIFMPYLILYYEKTLGMSNYVLIMAPAIILAALITAAYGKLYDMVGFEMSVVPAALILMAGYVFLFFFKGTILVFIGSLFMMTGYLSGMAMFGAMIRDHIPQDKAGAFQGLRIFGQVFIPGIIGPAIGAAVLSNAEVITNSDGTTSFLPNRNIYLAAFLAAVLLLVTLESIFRMIRVAHYELHTERARKAVAKWKQTGEQPWQEYPRPQLRRTSWFSLNGEWMLGKEKLLVPFPPQSTLSGYRKHLDFYLHYKKNFVLPQEMQGKTILLHFGAVDQTAEILVNGQFVQKHDGGYLPFMIDITEALNRNGEENKLEVKATDLLSFTYPYGKQKLKRGGMWYTPVSDIWQSVWLEAVPAEYIENIRITPTMSGVQIEVIRGGEGKETTPVTFSMTSDGIKVELSTTEDIIDLNLKQEYEKQGRAADLKLWTPDSPYLYPFTLTLGSDTVESYFALRTVSVKQIEGVNRICLNDEPIFLHGVLDQGYYPDGIYLPASEEEYTYDIRKMKELGFNTLRKHIKIEPECFYYDCDRYGMLVLQDMVNSGRYSFIRDTALPTLGMQERNDHIGGGSRKRKEIFIKHTLNTIQTLYNHPCIIYYTIFNEGWGQFDSDDAYDKVYALDATRIIDSTSGWFHGKKTQVRSLHVYFNNRTLSLSSNLPTLLSECGGYSYQIQDHYYSMYNHYGYGNCNSAAEVTDRLEQMYREMVLPAIPDGLCGCIYTQLSDVEDEVNGILTYDRYVTKVEEDRLQAIGEMLCGKKS